MKFTVGVTAILANTLFSSMATACCGSGCYAVKGVSYTNADCTGYLASDIANVGDSSGCLDVGKAAGIKAFNDGCIDSHPAFHFYKTSSCHGKGFKVIDKVGSNPSGSANGVCFTKPAGAIRMKVHAR